MRPVLYEGDLGELLAKYLGRYAGRDQECVAFPQAVTSVGHTSQWQAGARVIEQSHIAPGTVIANFKFENGRARFPNQHGYHVAIFLEFGNRRPGGGYTHFWVLDQWQGKTVARRNKNAWTAEQSERFHIRPSDDAEQYYIVNVP
ncbi:MULTISPECIES: BPSL0067 family protein [Massilia]|uniref:BPSL0067 family protein n=1 Tax=Massilia haematophila TaxID=457923 RepID=A0ABV7PNA2_9BURK|nr:BPSL0067 family protein [Massilia sp.]HBZ07699.1 hypothetical protein [Massilia sp.]